MNFKIALIGMVTLSQALAASAEGPAVSADATHRAVRYQIDYQCSIPKNNEIRLSDGMTYVAIPNATDTSISLLDYKVDGVTNLHSDTLDTIPVAEFEAATESPFSIHILVDVAPIDYRSRLADSTFSTPTPRSVAIYKGPSDSRYYTHAGELRIDPRSPHVAAIAANLKATTPLATVQNILIWLKKNIKYNTADHFTVDEVLQRGYGECGAFGATFTALCRACGLPARDIWGLTQLDDGERRADQMAGHVWAEVYFPGIGWVPVDPQMSDTLGFLPNTYVRMSELPPKLSDFPWYAYPGECLSIVGTRHPWFRVVAKP